MLSLRRTIAWSVIILSTVVIALLVHWVTVPVQAQAPPGGMVSRLGLIVAEESDFIDASSGNLRLQMGSVCINAGTDEHLSDGDGDQVDLDDLLVWSDDCDCAVGAWGDGVEIGAYGDKSGRTALMVY